jgi:hypothetical protein
MNAPLVIRSYSPRNLTAAAARFTTRKISPAVKTGDSGWQEEAWDFFHHVPEVRFASRWIGNAMGRARLYAGKLLPDGTTEEAPPDHPATRIVSEIAGGSAGQSELLRQIGPHLVVAGEGWLVIRPDEEGDGTTWRVLSTSEVQVSPGRMDVEWDGEKISIPAYDEAAPADPSTPVAIRIWEPSPRRRIEADSPVRASLGILQELRLLTAAVAAIARSRLTGRGVLVVPKGTRFPTMPGQADAEDDLIEIFMQVAETAIREPETAAATVPIVLEVPAEVGGAIQHLTFESAFDDLALKLRDEAVRRFATGMDIPAEVLTGMGTTSHWSAWLISAEAVLTGVDPRLGIVGHALTTQWLAPLLQAENVPDADEWAVLADTSQLRVQANRAQSALEVFKLGAISAEALRRETGFDESDAPDAAPPQPVAPPAPGSGDTVPVAESPGPPATLGASALADPAAVLGAIDGLVHNALTVAGFRLRTKPACPRNARATARNIPSARMHEHFTVTADEIDPYHLLDGAWDRVPEVCARYGLDTECLTATLDSYTRALIAGQAQYAYSHLPVLLRTSACLKEP